jgi:hypothetical protein
MVGRTLKNRLRWLKDDLVSPILVRGKPKIFCIGRNKTGTTSVKQAFVRLGYIVGNQHKAELLMSDYVRRDFGPVVKYCRSAQVFQDFPFSYPETYAYVDRAFPGSKFILTVRNSPEQWYQSLMKYHSALFGGGNVPSDDQLKNANYVYKGWMWDAMKQIHGAAPPSLYDEESLIESYLSYNREVESYFAARPGDLLVLNLSDADAYQRFCVFLGIRDTKHLSFPWENKTSHVSVRSAS